jgi:hypothetical protein
LPHWALCISSSRTRFSECRVRLLSTDQTPIGWDDQIGVVAHKRTCDEAIEPGQSRDACRTQGLRLQPSFPSPWGDRHSGEARLRFRLHRWRTWAVRPGPTRGPLQDRRTPERHNDRQGAGHRLINLLPYLDRGLMGILGPHIATEVDARQLVRAFYFGPLGERSFGATRSTDYNAGLADTAAYYREANEQMLVWRFARRCRRAEQPRRDSLGAGHRPVQHWPKQFCPKSWLSRPARPPEVVKTMPESTSRIRQAGRTMRLDVIQGRGLAICSMQVVVFYHRSVGERCSLIRYRLQNAPGQACGYLRDRRCGGSLRRGAEQGDEPRSVSTSRDCDGQVTAGQRLGTCSANVQTIMTGENCRKRNGKFGDAQLPIRLFPQNPSQPARRDYARCGAGTAGRRRRKVSRHRM